MADKKATTESAAPAAMLRAQAAGREAAKAGA
jgi:hypothetical protein